MSKNAQSRHTNDSTACKACEYKLLEAHPDIASWFRDTVKPKFQNAHVSWSFRGKEDQEKAFTEGKSKLHFPLSEHNKSNDNGDPCANALDLFELDFNGQASWPWGYFRDIAALPSPIAIEWGGTFKSIGDSDHFQLSRK